MIKKLSLIAMILAALTLFAACSGNTIPDGWELFTSPAMETEFCVPLADIESGAVPAFGDSQYSIFCFDGCGKGMDGVSRARAENGFVTAYMLTDDRSAMNPCQHFVMVDILDEVWGADIAASTELIFGKLYKIYTIRQDDMRQTVILVERDDTIYQITASAPANDFKDIYYYAKCIAATIHPSPIDWESMEGYEGSEKQKADEAAADEPEQTDGKVNFGG